MNAGMKRKLSKCRFGVREVDITGHKVSPKGLNPSEVNFEATKNLPEPTRDTYLLRFLRLIN